MHEILSSQQQKASVRLASQQRGTASCPVCHAVYAPAQSQERLLQAPPQAIEAALMSMCRFCFRCRRPACPSCWDEVHGVCGTCVQEAGLPFRQDAPPLPGTWSAPIHSTPPAQELSSPPPLVCVQPGLLQLQQTSDSPTPTSIPPSPDPVQTQQPAQPPHAPLQPAPPNTPGRSTGPSRRRLVWRIATLLMILALIGLGLVAALVVAASFYASINTFIATLLHVDIRAEIAYLWQLIHHLW